MATAAHIAFEAPDNHKSACLSKERPIDLVHLAKQTMGDKVLEAEILQMFARQARCLIQEIAIAEAATVTTLSHRLKGSASAVGAFKVSHAAARLEADPADAAAMATLHSATVEAENFITGLCR